MKYLNLGCGTHYSIKPEWSNLDFDSMGEGVIAHNLLSGIPFEDNTFDLVYHSHVLEHFSKDDGDKFISECVRVLKPGGILRIAIPDLERIAKKYIKFLEEGLQNPNDELTRANYEWMLIEMFDQTVRNKSGGRMGKYLAQDIILNEKLVFERIGEEGKDLRKVLLESKKRTTQPKPVSKINPGLVARVKSRIKSRLLSKWGIDLQANAIGKFRLGGEIHQWMYDRYSLAHLLNSKNINDIQVRNAFTSYVSDWSNYEIDGKSNITRKPDSLFIEGIKK